MNVLIISDETESKSFGQILSLKREIQELGRNKVDFFIFSKEGIIFNRELMVKGVNKTINLIERLIGENTYAAIIISLKLNNLRELFPEKRNMLDMIKDASPETTLFLFGASSVLKKLGKQSSDRVFLYPRPGVSKLTIEFKNDVIDYVKTKSR